MTDFKRVCMIPASKIHTAPEALEVSDFRLDPEAVQTIVDEFVTNGTQDLKNTKIVGTLWGSQPDTIRVNEETVHYIPVIPESIEAFGPRSLKEYNRIAVEAIGDVVAAHSPGSSMRDLLFEQRAPKYRKLRTSVYTGVLGLAALTASGGSVIAGEASGTTEYVVPVVTAASLALAGIKSQQYARSQPKTVGAALESAQKAYLERCRYVAIQNSPVLLNK